MKFRLVLLLFSSILLTSSYFEVAPPENGVLDIGNLFRYVIDELPLRAEYRFNEKNPVTDKGATLGRVLFYDKQLSVNNTTACASCHQQENAFGDNRKVSIGFNGQATARHAMRLVNVDFHADDFKFWDERSRSLEKTAALPLQNEIEMGFSGTNGLPALDSLLRKMDQLEYYQHLFQEVYGDSEITEERIALALTQFIRSINTFDTKFDEGFIEMGNEIDNFPNFTDAENRGKRLFFNPPIGIFGGEVSPFFGKGAACGFCHKAPGFDIIHIAQSNGVIGVAGDSSAIDLSVKRAPSLKNLIKPDGTPNGPFMHDGSLKTLEEVVDHYNFIPLDTRNTNLDGLLFPLDNGNVELRLSEEEKSDVVAFLKTLSGEDVYTNEKWSNPFDENGNLDLINCASCTTESETDNPEEMEPADSSNNTVFTEYPFLSELIDENNCDGTRVSVYDQGSYAYIFVSTENATTMYYHDGTFYCQDAPNYSCQEAYQLGEASSIWTCNTNVRNLAATRSISTQPIINNLEIVLFPNPNKGLFYLSFPKMDAQSMELSIINATGKTVQAFTLSANQMTTPFPVQLSGVAAGIYFVRIQTGDVVQVRKVLIESRL